jgi:hypothetical protein
MVGYYESWSAKFLPGTRKLDISAIPGENKLRLNLNSLYILVLYVEQGNQQTIAVVRG